MTARRITHHGQQGSRLSAFDSLFQTVEYAPPPPVAELEPIPVADTREVEPVQFIDALWAEIVSEPLRGGA
jgi:hypothetical protein